MASGMEYPSPLNNNNDCKHSCAFICSESARAGVASERQSSGIEIGEMETSFNLTIVNKTVK